MIDPVIEATIDLLRETRESVAESVHGLTLADAQRKQLQVAIAREYREQINPATSKNYSEKLADDLARTDARYVECLATIASSVLERDRLLAKAEALHFTIAARIAAQTNGALV